MKSIPTKLSLGAGAEQVARDNFAQSFEIVGRILSKLAGGGLRRIDLWPVDLFEQHYLDEGWIELDEHFFDVMTWLMKEGAITYQEEIPGTAGESGFGGVQLTSLGIKLLSFNTGEELPGATINETLSQDVTLAPPIYTKIGALVGGFLGGFTKTIS